MTVIHAFNSTQAQPRFNLYTGDTLEELPPLEWRIKDVLPATGLAAMYGPSSSGKSFLALDMACAIADGGTWFGHNVKPAPVVYVALEGERGFPKRLKAWEKRNNRICPADLYFVLDSFKLSSPQDVTDLGAACPIGCVLIIDTLNRASPLLEENSSRDMGTILSACKTLTQATQGLVLLIHHTGKDEARGLRGHSSLIAALDSSIEVSRSLGQRAWCIAKSKDDSDEVWHGFKLAIEQVGMDEDGPITSCAVEPVGGTISSPPTLPQGKLQKLILGPLRKLIEDEGEIPSQDESLGHAVISWARAIQAASELLPPEIASKHRATRAKDAIDGLIRRNLLMGTKDYIWIHPNTRSL